MKLNMLGEFGFLEVLQSNIVSCREDVIRGTGDDAAVLRVSGDNWLLWTTDMVVEDIHFSFSTSTPEQVGWKAMVASVSDIAAMGGWPTHALISLGAPLQISVDILLGIYRGFQRANRVYGFDIVGGDTVRTTEGLIINISLLGAVEAGRAIYRSGAKPGDLVFVTGTLGNSAAGLYLCQHPQEVIAAEAVNFLRTAHLEPKACVGAGRVLAKTGKVSALNDISDGLAREICEICQASGVGCLIREAALPVDERMGEAARLTGQNALDWVLYGGEDFQLVFTVPFSSAEFVQQEMKANNEECYLIGEILRSEEGIFLQTQKNELLSLKSGGYDHFRIEAQG